MARREIENTDVIKKGEASRLLGFGATAGYAYLSFLEDEKVIVPIKLPGIKTPRYRKAEILAIADNRDPDKYSEIGTFKTNN